MVLESPKGLVILPIMIVGYVIGLLHGPKGVAFAYSGVMILWIIPVIALSVHGTVISVRCAARGKPTLVSSIVAAALASQCDYSTVNHCLLCPGSQWKMGYFLQRLL
jgi:hypothetical protein